MQPWPTLVGMKSLVEFGINNKTLETYLRADYFCKRHHDDINYRRYFGREAVERAEGTNDGPLVPILEYDPHFFARPRPWTVGELRFDLVSGSSSSLSRATLSTLPAEGSGVTLRSRFSVVGSDACYFETVDGDDPDFGEAYGIYRRFISEGVRHSCLSVYSMPALFLDRGCLSVVSLLFV